MCMCVSLLCKALRCFRNLLPLYMQCLKGQRVFTETLSRTMSLCSSYRIILFLCVVQCDAFLCSRFASQIHHRTVLPLWSSHEPHPAQVCVSITNFLLTSFTSHLRAECFPLGSKNYGFIWQLSKSKLGEVEKLFAAKFSCHTYSQELGVKNSFSGSLVCSE